MTKLIPISQARKELPKLIRELQEHPEIQYNITVFNRVVAELKAPGMINKSGLAAKKLLELSKKKPKPKQNAEREDVSSDTKKYLYQK